jgi:hypothetical protein
MTFQECVLLAAGQTCFDGSTLLPSTCSTLPAPYQFNGMGPYGSPPPNNASYSPPPVYNSPNTSPGSSPMPGMPGGPLYPPVSQPEAMCDPGRIPEPSSQGQLLLRWRESLRAWNSPVLASWGMGDPCSFAWSGVQCLNGTVVGISLASQMQGSWINAEGPADWDALANMTALRSLQLQVGEVCD